MRFNYFYFYDCKEKQTHGISNKAISQCINLERMGLDVNLFLFGHNDISNTKLNEIKKVYNTFLPPGSNIFSKISRQFQLRKILINHIESASYSDIVYLRYPYPLLFMIAPFFTKNKKCKIVSEHNTIEYREFKLSKFYSFLLVDLCMGLFLRRLADGIIGVTEEITHYEVERSGDLKKPHITIGNGIDVYRIKLRRPPTVEDKRLDLLCIASFSRWHGIDRLIKGIANYSGPYKIILHIAGVGLELESIRELSNRHHLGEKVIFHGFLDGETLNDLFDKCHIAIGSLGIHRKGLTISSELKSREYAARGIPFICSAADQDFPVDFPYRKIVIGDESPIDVEDIIQFAEEVYSDHKHHLRMRDFAEKNLDWSLKMMKLKEFCEALAEG